MLMAIDAGTGSARAVLFEADGTEIAAAQEEWHHLEDPRYPGSSDFDIATNWALICRCIRKVMAISGRKAEDVVAISATSMREAFVAYDDSGTEIWACANVDSRASSEVRELTQSKPHLQSQLYEISGQTFALATLPRLLWLKRNMPGVFARVSRISMLSDWILARLSGELFSDPSNAGTTGLLSLKTRDWNRQALELLEMPSDVLPPIVEPGSVIGKLTRKAAAETDLLPSTLIVAGGGDCQIGSVGLNLVREGDCAVLGGTFWQQLVNVSDGLRDPAMDLRINPHAIAGLNQAEAISFFVGSAMRWFRDSFGQEELRNAGGDPSRAYSLLEALTVDIPAGSYGILPILSDVMHYGRWYHAAPSLLNLSLDPARSGKGAIFKALQENAAIVASLNLHRVFALAKHTPDRVVFASGAAKSERWCQILSDVTGLAVVVPKVTEATALGGAAAASVGAGLYDNLCEASSAMVRTERDYQPNRSLAGVYDDVRERWRIAYASQLALVDQGVTTSMWKAPGL
ncbi:autoinducer kinase [Devosia limi DSM 17137]|uniref:Autoinducer 2 (AI-2) kinase n=1 Tax=Devosia limi DSM 17137 TaxID=1121477 RepID=A0A0F5L3M3_9HYPH|nr:autoinducer-2 kinase [Devosia limi]KKB76815.1 autoinducer kinase [Devosia limi DSM 17137]SHF28693.1 autoinducer 2 (AI-2) kinase [Devosia limi DSM 17137]